MNNNKKVLDAIRRSEQAARAAVTYADNDRSKHSFYESITALGQALAEVDRRVAELEDRLDRNGLTA